MEYKVLALDLDDTLLNSSHELSDYQMKKLIALQETGVKVILASGRPLHAMIPIANKLKLAFFESYIIGLNGAAVLDLSNDKEVYSTSIGPSDAQALIEFFIERDIAVSTYEFNQIVINQANEYTNYEAEVTNSILRIEPDYFTQSRSYQKIMGISHPNKIFEASSELALLHLDQIRPAITKPIFLECVNRQASKGNALMAIATKLGISANQIVAVGDSENDISMLEIAGLGIAMANAMPHVKAMADFETLTNDQDGIAQVIDRFFY